MASPQSAANLPEPEPRTGDPAPKTGEQIVAWVGEHQQRLWRYLRLLGCDRDVAEDIAQDVFLVAIQKEIPQLPTASCRAWLQEAARRIFLAHLRKTGRRPRLLDPGCLELAWVEGLASGAGDQSQAMQARAMEALQECLATLVPREIEALRMRYARGQSRQQMAKALGISQYGVKMLLRRVRNRLRRCVEWRVDNVGGRSGNNGGGSNGGGNNGGGTGGL